MLSCFYPIHASLRWWAIAIVVALTLASPAAGAAQAAAAEDPAQTEAARALFARGVQALDDSRFSDAADLLTRSLAIRESGAARFNRALAHRGLGAYRTAIVDLDQCLALATEPRDRGLRAQAEEMKAELTRALVHLTVEASGGADRVLVNGEEIATRDGRYETVQDPGSVRVEVRREGYAPNVQVLELPQGASESVGLRADESPLDASIRIDATPEEALLFWEGDLLGQGNAALEVPAGEYEVSARAEGYEDDVRTLHLSPGEQARLSFSLAELSTPLAKKWWFWTALIAGAAVVAVVTIALVTLPDPQYGEGTLGTVSLLRGTP